MDERVNKSQNNGQRDADGRLRKGVVLNPRGRPPGSPNRATKEIRRAFLESLDSLDEWSLGENGMPYLTWVGIRHPKTFVQVLAGLAPKQIAVRSETTRKVSPEFYEELRQRALDAGQKAGMILDISPAETAVERIETDGAVE